MIILSDFRVIRCDAMLGYSSLIRPLEGRMLVDHGLTAKSLSRHTSEAALDIIERSVVVVR
jgi:hypothetical protein